MSSKPRKKDLDYRRLVEIAPPTVISLSGSNLKGRKAFLEKIEKLNKANREKYSKARRGL